MSGLHPAAFLEVANDSGFDALWFARGGYGSCRIAEEVLAGLGPAARKKAYLGYSDAGYVLAGLYRAGFERVAHGPMPGDVRRDGGGDRGLRLIPADQGREPARSGALVRSDLPGQRDPGRVVDEVGVRLLDVDDEGVDLRLVGDPDEVRHAAARAGGRGAGSNLPPWPLQPFLRAATAR